MGCASGKAAGASADGVVLSLSDRANSALKDGTQSDEVKRRSISITYKAQELREPDAQEPEIEGRQSAIFNEQRIGTSTCHGFMPMPAPGKKKATTSKAKINQDRGLLCWPFCGSYNEALLCVFDGHGSRGEKAAEYCTKTLPQLLADDQDALRADPAACLKANILRMDEQLRTESDCWRHMHGSGTTASIVYMRADQMWVANVGDSRAVKASRAVAKGAAVRATELSVDHKLDTPSERERIERKGGEVRRADADAPLRVFFHDATGLAMSRSIGDDALKPAGVVAEADVTHWTLTPEDEFVVVASDGVWEFIPSQEAAEVVGRSPSDATAGCQALVRLASERWAEHEKHYRDDITAIVVHLPFLEEDTATAEPVPEEAPYPVDAKASSTPAPKVAESPDDLRLINSGERGIARMTSFEAGQTGRTADAKQAPAAGGEDEDDDEDDGGGFNSRRLSVVDPYAEGMRPEDEGEEEEAPAKAE